MVDIFFFGSFLSPQIQVAWISALTLPFMIPPLGRWFNLDIDWDKKMFDKWLGKKDKDGNVVKFPELKSVPEVQPPAPKEEPVTTYYRLGITSNGRVSFQMGYSEITMNAGGINNMIAQLELFRDQILQYEDGGPDDDPDGGEPVPVPEQEQKAA
jgi:hypothetical protein